MPARPVLRLSARHLCRTACFLCDRPHPPSSSLHPLAGQIGYALVPMIARGLMLGPNQPVILHLLDIPPAAESLNGVVMELVDAAFPLLRGARGSASARPFLASPLAGRFPARDRGSLLAGTPWSLRGRVVRPHPERKGEGPPRPSGGPPLPCAAFEARSSHPL